MSIRPVINKTECIFKRDPSDPRKIMPEILPEIEDLLKNEPYIATVKTDGTCGMVCQTTNGLFQLLRRQDIRIGSRNYNYVMENLTLTTIAGLPCAISKLVRGNNKTSPTVPIYIFQLDTTGKPELENNHLIGFTPLLHDFGEDKHAVTTIDGKNGTADMKLYTTAFLGSLDIPVRAIPVAELMVNQTIMTVEIMGPKISNKYGFIGNQHFINPHGSIIFQANVMPTITYDSIKSWFENDAENRWANVEGIVFHFPSINKRYKIHRGHVGLESTWRNKKQSGIRFI
jgi:hypothetical protein